MDDLGKLVYRIFGVFGEYYHLGDAEKIRDMIEEYISDSVEGK